MCFNFDFLTKNIASNDLDDANELNYIVVDSD